LSSSLFRCNKKQNSALLPGSAFSEYEYVDKEEHDAKLLFSGKFLKEYHVNKDTGEIEEIQ